MTFRSFFSVFVFLFLASQSFTLSALAEDTPKFIPDKLLCAKMIRFGKEAYQRGRYLDAKQFFKRATMADPASKKAWRYYDQAVIFALAEKVEAKENRDLLSAGTSRRSLVQPAIQQSVTPPAGAEMNTVPPLPPVATPVEEAETDNFEPEEEEGC